MKLYIAEKPSVAEAIALALGGKKTDGKYICPNGEVVTWCYGHMLELAPPDDYTSDNIPLNSKGNKIWRFDELPIIPQSWKFKVKANTSKQLKIIRDLIKSADVIVQAGDPDRAGQALVDELLDFYNYSGKVLRYWCSSLDTVSVKKALSDLKDNADYRPMGEADFARSCADWLIGMNLSRAFTLSNRENGGSSLVPIGRVQTPTMRLVVDRDNAIKNFKPIPYFKIEAVIHADGATYRAKWVPSNAQSGLDEESRLISESVADSLVAKGASGVVKDVSVTPKKQTPPLCFSLSEIQSLANKIWGYDAEKTLDTCQALYEKHKATTYPRVDCGYLQESQFDERFEVIECIKSVTSNYHDLIGGCELQQKSKAWNDKKVTAHHGIIPTVSTHAKLENFNEAERNIYDLIVRRYLCQFYPNFEYDETIIIHDINHEKFKSTGKAITNNGWKVLFSKDSEENNDSEDSSILPKVTINQQISADVEKKNAKTSPPKPFTEGTLLTAMTNIYQYVEDNEARKLLKDTDGLGTEATRASILSDLKRRGFLSVEKKNIVSTALAQELIASLPEEIKSPVLSARAESFLSEIEKGLYDKKSFINDQANFVSCIVDDVKENGIKIKSDAKPKDDKPKIICPKCNKHELMRRPDKKKKNAFYWMCKGIFDEKDQCKSFFKEKKGKPDLS